MNFLCGDESGAPNHSSVMVVCGLMVEARAFFKTANIFQKKFSKARELKKFSKNEFKTHMFVGRGADAKGRRNFERRKNLVSNTCELIVKNELDIFAIGISYKKLDSILKKSGGKNQIISRTLGGVFISELVRIKAQGRDDESGRTFAVFDNHPARPYLNKMLENGNSWYDGIQQVLGSKRDKNASRSTSDTERFDHIVDKTGYYIESNFSSHVQTADLVSYVYQRHLSMADGDELWKGEKNFIRKCVTILEPRRYRTEESLLVGDEKCTDLHDVIRHCGLHSSARK